MRTSVKTVNRNWTLAYPSTLGGLHYEYQQGAPSVTELTFTRSDVTKVKQINGWRKPTAYESDEVSARNPTLEFVRTNHTGLFAGTSIQYEGPCYPQPSLQPVAGAPSTATWNSLYYMAVEKAKDQAINIAILAAEMGETIALVRGRSQLFGQLFDLAKAKRWKELLDLLGIKNYTFKKAKNDVSGRWMELWFGWNPILQDIYGSIDLLGRKSRNEGLMVVARATLSPSPVVEQFKLPLDWRMSYGAYAAGYVAFKNEGSNTIVRSTRKEGHSVALWFRVDNERLQYASALGLTNPASVIWELTTLSWFADFFIDVGNWLSALDTLGLTYQGGSGTWWYHRTNEVKTVTRDAPGSTSSERTSGGGGTYSRRMSKRIVFASTPAPFYLKNPFSVWKAVTSAALVAQKFR